MHIVSSRPAYRQGMVWTMITGRKGGCLFPARAVFLTFHSRRQKCEVNPCLEKCAACYWLLEWKTRLRDYM